MNEYFRFDFELKQIEQRLGGPEREGSEGGFYPCFWESFPYSLSYSTVLTGFQSMFENYTILNCCVALDSKNVSKLKLKCFLGPGDTNRQKQLKNQKQIIRFGHTKGLLFKKRTTFWPKFPSWGI